MIPVVFQNAAFQEEKIIRKRGQKNKTEKDKTA
jgi:hypothetical protein